MTTDQASEELSEELTKRVDSFTLRANISRRDTARIYRELASEFRDRANGLESEADADEDDE